MEEFKIPCMNVEFLNPTFKQSQLSQKINHQHFFTFAGAIHVQGLINNEKANLGTIIDVLVEDVE